jgi:hypothetical protein
MAFTGTQKGFHIHRADFLGFAGAGLFNVLFGAVSIRIKTVSIPQRTRAQLKSASRWMVLRDNNNSNHLKINV